MQIRYDCAYLHHFSEEEKTLATRVTFNLKRDQFERSYLSLHKMHLLLQFLYDNQPISECANLLNTTLAPLLIYI